ncbi:MULTISPECIES: hypothetical protein [unclassified Bifidobacterium]|nr:MULTISPECIES: hypothetical protein [unclassified Bifidobacterium]
MPMTYGIETARPEQHQAAPNIIGQDPVRYRIRRRIRDTCGYLWATIG